MTASMPGEERRAHPRLILKAFGFEHFCILRPRSGTAPCTARLVDVSRGGARCRLEKDCVLAGGEFVVLESQLAHHGFALNNIAGVVRWTSDGYVGLQFEQELAIGVAELQQMLTP